MTIYSHSTFFLSTPIVLAIQFWQVSFWLCRFALLAVGTNPPPASPLIALIDSRPFPGGQFNWAACAEGRLDGQIARPVSEGSGLGIRWTWAGQAD